jgi:RNA polymerase sigma-70 factor, ECF subfamily
MLTITGISRQAIATRPMRSASAQAASDEDLLRAIAAGDRNAMHALYARHNVRVYREVIDLVYYHEKSVEEVAGIVGVPASTVKTRMFYARQRLGTLLESAGIDGF